MPCSICGKTGHNRSSCTRLGSGFFRHIPGIISARDLVTPPTGSRPLQVAPIQKVPPDKK